MRLVVPGSLSCTLLLLALAACRTGGGGPVIDEESTGFGPGYTCSVDSQCASGYCLQIYGLLQCAATCVDGGDCPAGLICAAGDARDPASALICLPPNPDLCVPCTQDSDCGRHGHRCDLYDGRLVCLSACELTCPLGYTCEAVTQGTGTLPPQCLPAGGTCSCGPSNNGAQRICGKSLSGVGTCYGVETCDGALWSACDAPTPAPEEVRGCNGLDDNCDGQTDVGTDGNPLYLPCGFGYESDTDARPLECLGIQVCLAGQWQPCWPAPPLAETACDGRDEDCDGVIDDGYLGTNEHCSGCGDACAPGQAMASVYSWGCQGADVGCLAWSCRWPNFDLDAVANNGCELADDVVTIDSLLYHTYNYQNARVLHRVSDYGDGKACEGMAWDAECGEVHFCNARLPRDGRANYYSASLPTTDAIEGNDFYRIWYTDTWLGVTDLTLRIAFDLEGRSYTTTIEACLSNPIADSGGASASAPEFPVNRCQQLDLAGAAPHRISFGNSFLNDAGRYYYLWLEALPSGQRFGGRYHVQFTEGTPPAGYVGDSGGPCP